MFYEFLSGYWPSGGLEGEELGSIQEDSGSRERGGRQVGERCGRLKREVLGGSLILRKRTRELTGSGWARTVESLYFWVPQGRHEETAAERWEGESGVGRSVEFYLSLGLLGASS